MCITSKGEIRFSKAEIVFGPSQSGHGLGFALDSDRPSLKQPIKNSITIPVPTQHHSPTVVFHGPQFTCYLFLLFSLSLSRAACFLINLRYKDSPKSLSNKILGWCSYRRAVPHALP